MTFSKFIRFLLKTVISGLAVAFLYVLVIEPELLHDNSRVVEFRESGPPPETPAPVTPAAQSAASWSGPVSYAEAVERAAPAVVNVHTAKLVTHRVHPLLEDPIFKHFFGDRFKNKRQTIQTSLGSGVIISDRGYVVTNNHVIQDADEIQVLLADGRIAQATVVGVDAETDLAVLRIELDKLPTLVIGDSNRLRVGDVALAIGNPFGVGQTVTFGIISATGRDHLGINTYEDFIQTDAAINPGNSGGALVNAHGELIGINSAIYSRTGGSQGIGFAIPASLAKGVMKQIIEHGHVVRGWLGLEAQDLTPVLAESLGLDTGQRGVLIAGVLRGGPADTAGIQPGDILTAIGDITVSTSTEAMKIISKLRPDTVVVLSGVRESKQFTVRAKIIQRPPSSALQDS
jgi:serine protease DegS